MSSPIENNKRATVGQVFAALAIVVICAVVCLGMGNGVIPILPVPLPNNSTESHSTYVDPADEPVYKSGYSAGLQMGKRDKAYNLDFRTRAQLESDAGLLSTDPKYIDAYCYGYEKGYRDGAQ